MSSEMINCKTFTQKGKLTGITWEKRSIIQNKGKDGNTEQELFAETMFCMWSNYLQISAAVQEMSRFSSGY